MSMSANDPVKGSSRPRSLSMIAVSVVLHGEESKKGTSVSAGQPRAVKVKKLCFTKQVFDTRSSRTKDRMNECKDTQKCE